MVAAEAERIGLDPNIAIHALYKETGNLKNPESARSRAGALGVMQLMPKTAKELGVDPLIPEENIRGGVMYLKTIGDAHDKQFGNAATYRVYRDTDPGVGGEDARPSGKPPASETGDPGHDEHPVEETGQEEEQGKGAADRLKWITGYQVRQVQEG
jgi:hypothetical protein